MALSISKKEKKMLIVLGIFLFAFVYYEMFNYVINPRIIATKNKKVEIETTYNNVKETIANMEKQRGVKCSLKDKVQKMAEPYYPTISEEHIIMQIDRMLKQCELEGGVEWDPIECDVPLVLEKSDMDIGNVEGSMSGSAEEYREKFDPVYSKIENEKVKQSGSSITAEEASVSVKNDKDDKSKKTSKDSNILKVIRLKGTIKIYGTYENLVKFTKALAAYDRKICLCGFGEADLNQEGTRMIKASIGMVAYSIPKLNNDIDTYLQWSYKGQYGKTEPFFYSTESDGGINQDKPERDFVVTARSESSDMSQVSIGKVDDNLRNAYICSGGSSRENLSIKITEKDGKYYYKCSTNKQSLPSGNSTLGSEFVPYGENIIVDVLSEKRTGKYDKYKAEINIENNTNKQIIVNVSSDDQNNPRISVIGDKKNVIVNKK